MLTSRLEASHNLLGHILDQDHKIYSNPPNLTNVSWK